MSSRRFLRPRPALAGAATAICMAVAACSPKSEPPKPTPLLAVETARVTAPSSSALVRASGPLERRREMTLSFRNPGELTALNAEAGDRISAGQVLASLDPTGVAAAETQARVNVERARRDLARDRTLFAQGFVSRQRVDDRESALKAAQAQASAAGFDRRWARLVSPASGVVLARLAQSGEVVQPGQAVLRVADETSPLVLRANFADRDAARLALGASAILSLESLPGQTLSGRVTRVGEAAAARTGTVPVEIEILSPGADLRSGQIATAEISASLQGQPGEGFARVPAEAILEANGSRAFVLVLDAQSRAHRRQVQFQGFDGNDALILGLAPGSSVITAGAGFVSDGEKVKVTDPSSLLATKPGSPK